MFLIGIIGIGIDSVVLYLSHFFLYKASYQEKFLGSLAAEVTERVIPCVAGMAEGGVERSVVIHVNVDASTPVDARPAAAWFPLRGILHEGKVFETIACEHACVILSHFCPAVAYQNGFQVDAKLRVTVEN